MESLTDSGRQKETVTERQWHWGSQWQCRWQSRVGSTYCTQTVPSVRRTGKAAPGRQGNRTLQQPTQPSNTHAHSPIKNTHKHSSNKHTHTYTHTHAHTHTHTHIALRCSRWKKGLTLVLYTTCTLGKLPFAASITVCMCLGHAPKLCSSTSHRGWPMATRRSESAFRCNIRLSLVLGHILTWEAFKNNTEWQRWITKCFYWVDAAAWFKNDDIFCTHVKNRSQHQEYLLNMNEIDLKCVTLMSVHVWQMIWLYKIQNWKTLTIFQ